MKIFKGQDKLIVPENYDSKYTDLTTDPSLNLNIKLNNGRNDPFYIPWTYNSWEPNEFVVGIQTANDPVEGHSSEYFDTVGYYGPNYSTFMIDEDTGEWYDRNGNHGAFSAGPTPDITPYDELNRLYLGIAKDEYNKQIMRIPVSSFFSLDIPSKGGTAFALAPELLDAISTDYSKAGIPLIYALGHIKREHTGVDIDEIKDALNNHIGYVEVRPLGLVKYHSPYSLVLDEAYKEANKAASVYTNLQKEYIHPFVEYDNFIYNHCGENPSEECINEAASEYYKYCDEYLNEWEEIDKYNQELTKKAQEVYKETRLQYVKDHIDAADKLYAEENPNEENRWFKAPAMRFLQGYNSGDPSYYQKVADDASWVMQIPKVKEWMKKHGYDMNTMIKEFNEFNRKHDIHATYNPTAYTTMKKNGGKLIPKHIFAKEGSPINIKKENEGSFTKYCGGKVTEECIRKGKNSPDPKIRKKATFAQNVRKFKHHESSNN